MRAFDKALALLASAWVAVWFLHFAGPGLHSYFSGDDLMNLNLAWMTPAGQLLRSSLFFWRGYARPLGEAWYRAIFFFAGFDPLPFHLVNLLVLAFNLFLTYALVRRLSGSREAGALALLLGAFHARFSGLYYDTGTIYDVLCYCFYIACLLLYVRVRQSGRTLAGWNLAGFLTLLVCALGSKELAVTMPAVLLAYEGVYHAPLPRSWPAAAKWIRYNGRGVVIAGLCVVAYAAGKASSPVSLLRLPAYRPVFTMHRFLVVSGNYLDQLFYQTAWFDAPKLFLLWGLMLMLAAYTRRKALWFAWFYSLLAPIPLDFIDPRGGPAYYLPSFGWLLYLSVILVAAGDWFLARRGHLEEYWPTRIKASLVFAFVAAILYPYHVTDSAPQARIATASSLHNREVSSQLRRLRPSLRKGARLLFLKDPARPGFYDLWFLVRLLYLDKTLTVDRLSEMRSTPGPTELSAYDGIFDVRDGRLVEVPVPRMER